MSSSPRSPPRSWAARWKNESCRFGQGIRIQGAERAHRHRIPDVALKQNSPGLMLPPIKKSPESRALRGLCLFLAKGPIPGPLLPALPRYGKMTGLPEPPVPALVLSPRPPSSSIAGRRQMPLPARDPGRQAGCVHHIRRFRSVRAMPRGLATDRMPTLRPASAGFGGKTSRPLLLSTV